MYGAPLEPTDQAMLGPADHAVGGTRGAILRRWLSGPAITNPDQLDDAVIQLLDELDDVEG